MRVGIELVAVVVAAAAADAAVVVVAAPGAHENVLQRVDMTKRGGNRHQCTSDAALDVDGFHGATSAQVKGQLLLLLLLFTTRLVLVRRRCGHVQRGRSETAP